MYPTFLYGMLFTSLSGIEKAPRVLGCSREASVCSILLIILYHKWHLLISAQTCSFSQNKNYLDTYNPLDVYTQNG